MVRRIATVLVLAAALAGGAVLAVRSGALTPSDDYLKMRYTDARSRFVTVDGVPIHVVEEGRGPALILLHGHLGSARQFEGWADVLREDFRVIRPDVPPYGLSGPDPTGDFSGERQYQLMRRFIEDLVTDGGYERLYIGGTSTGSILAMRYAAEHPDRVEKLLLSTVPAYTPGARVPPPLAFSALAWLSANVLNGYTPDVYWRLFLENIFGQDDRVTALMVQSYADLNNRKNAAASAEASIMSKVRNPFDTAAIAARVTAPTLIQWAGQSPVLGADGLDQVTGMLTSAPLTTIRYPDLGHKLMVEDPARTVADARAFLAGSPAE